MAPAAATCHLPPGGDKGQVEGVRAADFSPMVLPQTVWLRETIHRECIFKVGPADGDTNAIFCLGLVSV